MSKKKTSSKKPSTAKKKPSTAKKKPANKVPQKIEVDVPTVDEVKDLVSDTLNAVKDNNWQITPAVKKGFLARVKSWFKVS
jgi:hypothetical protein